MISEAKTQLAMSGSKLDNIDLLDKQRTAKQAEASGEPLPVFKALQEVKSETGNITVSFVLHVHFNIV